MAFILPILIGITAGISSGLFGIGGGIIIVPLLLYFYKYSQQTATATSLTALLLPVGALGLWQFYKNGDLTSTNLKVGFTIATGMFVGTFLGAKISTYLPSEVLTKMFSIFLVLVALRLWLSK